MAVRIISPPFDLVFGNDLIRKSVPVQTVHAVQLGNEEFSYPQRYFFRLFLKFLSMVFSVYLSRNTRKIYILYLRFEFFCFVEKVLSQRMRQKAMTTIDLKSLASRLKDRI